MAYNLFYENLHILRGSSEEFKPQFMRSVLPSLFGYSFLPRGAKKVIIANYRKSKENN